MHTHFLMAHDARFDDWMVARERRVVARRAFVGTTSTKQRKVAFVRKRCFQPARLAGEKELTAEPDRIRILPAFFAAA